MVEIIAKNYPYWEMRALGGVIFTIRMVFFIYNIYMTARRAKSPAKAQEVKDGWTS